MALNFKRGYFWVALFALYALYMAFNAENIAAKMASSPLHIALFWYMVGSPQYLLLMWFIISTAHGEITRKIKAFLASLLIIFGLDIVGFVRLSRSGMSTDVVAKMNSDTYIVTWLMNTTHMSYDYTYWLYYVILAIGVIVLALWLLGEVEFSKKFSGGGP